MKMRSVQQCAAVLAVCLSTVACSRPESKFPSREIKLIVQAAPGGLSDTISRVTASLMEKKLGVPVVCENKPGASGALAFSYVTRQAPNGYTIGHGPVEITTVRSLGFGEVGPEEMDLLCLVSKTQPVLAVKVDAPWQTYAQFIQAVRARPGYYVVGNSGTGSIWHINAMLLERDAGLRLVHCPFAGSSGALTALLGGHVDAVVAGVGEVGPHVRAGRMKALLVFGPERSSILEGVPSSADENAPPGNGAWSGFYGPKGMPGEIKKVLMSALRAASESPEFARLCEERGMEPVFLESEQFQAFAREQAVFFAGTIPGLLEGLR